MDQLVLLRRMIVARARSRLRYLDEDGAGELLYGPDGFYGGFAEVLSHFRRTLLAERVQVSRVSDDEVSVDGMQVWSPARVVVWAVQDWAWPEAFRQRLLQFADRLPPVSVRLVPLHRVGFNAMPVYLDMHRRVIRHGSCPIGAYLKEAKTAADQDQRLRTFLVSFCLGLIAPADPARAKRSSQRASVLARIIRRVREL